MKQHQISLAVAGVMVFCVAANAQVNTFDLPIESPAVAQPAGIITQPGDIITQPGDIITQPGDIIAPPPVPDSYPAEQFPAPTPAILPPQVEEASYAPYSIGPPPAPPAGAGVSVIVPGVSVNVQAAPLAVFEPVLTPVTLDGRCISYKHHDAIRLRCECIGPPIHTVLTLHDPRRGCLVDIPICIPACCFDQPDIKCRKALFGRGLAVVRYDCGYLIKVIFKADGDIDVHSFGKV